MAPISLIVLARGGRHYLSSLSIKGAALEKILLKKMAAEKRGSVMFCEEKQLVIVPEMCNHW